MVTAESRNMTLLAQDDLGGFGNVGEGMVIQLARDGRRVLWLAHESAPKNLTALDVGDPRQPSVIFQSDLPHGDMRSNSLDLAGDLLVVAYQTKTVGLQPAGVEIFDVADPTKPKRVGFFDASGPHSRGTHHLWFVDPTALHIASGAADFTPRHPKDDQCYRIVDLRNPSKPAEIGRWWLPGTRDGDAEPAPVRHPVFDSGFRAHNTNVYPKRPDRAWVGYLDGGAMILDIADKSRPKLVSHWRYSPPFNGFTHTVLPLLGRNLLIVADEAVMDAGADWPKLVWVVDARVETNLVPIATFPAPPYQEFVRRGGRFGAHNLHENLPVPGSWRSEQIVIGTFFNAGVRAYDVLNPYQPKEVAHFVPEAPNGARTGAVQLNDVFVDEQRIVYTVDRHIGGLYILEMTF